MHNVQVEDDCVGVKEPLEQLEHEVEPDGAYDPGLQSPAIVKPAEEQYCPAMQRLQVLEPVEAWYLPMEHITQLEDATAEV